MKIVPYGELSSTDLVVDAVYEGGSAGNAADDPIGKLLPGIGNQGGFRLAGRGADKRFVVLYSSGEDIDWPDRIDPITGKFVYYGDNKKAGHELHDTRPAGNRLLRDVFGLIHADQPTRDRVPPFFVFLKHPTRNSTRSVQFKGLAVPGYGGVPATEDLVTVWKSSKDQRFQNYKALFTILDAPVVDRHWLTQLRSMVGTREGAPDAWNTWVECGQYSPLCSTPTIQARSEEQQRPTVDNEKRILQAVFEYFQGNPFGFEEFAATAFRLQDQRVFIDEITRGVVDGGRDAIGRYQLGSKADPVYVEFALEAKCYEPGLIGKKVNRVGVRDVARLISRLRHRQFGVLVTTSVVARQAYAEIREDGHPVVILSGRDVVEILISAGYGTPQRVSAWLKGEFPQ